MVWDADGTKKLQCMYHEELTRHLNTVRDKQIEDGVYHGHETRKEGPGAILRKAGIIKTFKPKTSCGNALHDKFEAIRMEAEHRAK